ncbi:XRE family transcriptional regulator [Pseudomonas aeruginosa]
MEPVKRGKEVDLSAKLKAIRATERLTQVEFCSLVDISLSSWKKYEASITDMGLAPVLKITNHPRFKKYTLWLMTGDTAPECGQVSPE